MFIDLPSLIIGTFQNNNYQKLYNIIDASFRQGIYAFDTAPSYGTEVILGKALKEASRKYNISRDKLFISNKIDAWQMLKSKGHINKFIEKALLKMNLDYFDSLMIHWPIGDYFSTTWETMINLQEQGKLKHIGISNVRVRHLTEYKEQGIVPECIQIEHHPLRICQKEIDYCKINAISILSYSPLCRMHPHIVQNANLKDIAFLHNKSIGQVVLRWQLETGTIPIFMSKNPQRLVENSAIFDFTLSPKEICLINQLDENYKLFPESWGCPGF